MEYALRDSILPITQDMTAVEQIFAKRGIKPENLQHYLYPTKNDEISPTEIEHINDGVQMLFKHIKAFDKVLAIVDCDCDGYTSSALLINYLYSIFPGYTQNYIDYHIHAGKEHGLNDQLDYILEHPEYKLIICVDSASNDYERHKILADKGIDILIIDHHEAEYYSPNACTLNNQMCDYPTKSLCGRGMAYKFCEYLDTLLNVQNAHNYVDLAALGLVGDMMSLLDYETRFLILQGIENIRNPFFKEMTEEQEYSIDRNGGLCPFTLSFYIVPAINGTIRAGSYSDKMLLFEAMLDFKAYEQIQSTKRGAKKGQTERRVVQACRNATNIKRHQDKERDDSLAAIKQKIEEKHLDSNKIIAVKLSPNQLSNKNLTGLIANKLMADYHHPFLILSECMVDGKKCWAGSARGYETLDFTNFKDFVNESGLAYLRQGHQMAFGFGITDENFTKFIDYSNQALAKCNFNPCTKVDFIWQANNFSGQDVVDIAGLDSVWGQDVDKPHVAIEHVKVTAANINLMSRDKHPTLQIELPNRVSLIKFKSSEEEFEKLFSETGYVEINVIGTCKKNEWNGNINGQILIEDYEIIGESKYYF